MCYPKPGPRCSAHALLALTTEKKEFKDIPKDNPSKMLKYYEKLSKLEDIYCTTPAGLQEMQENLALTDPADRIKYFKLQTKIEVSIKKRENQLKALKKTQRDAGNIPHEAFDFAEYGETEFPEYLNKLPSDSLKIDDMLKDSSNWANKLTSDEIKAIRWYTKGGYQEIYSFQNHNNIMIEGKTAEQITSYISNIDTALAKYERDEPIVVYRGVGMVDEGYLSMDKAAKYFKEGDEYAHKTYSSTSIDSGVAERFASSNIVLALKTRKAVPVIALSQHGIGEKELMLPANEKFKVTKVAPNKYGVTVVYMEAVTKI